MRFSIPHLTVIATLATASICDAEGLYGQTSLPYTAGYAPAVAAPATASVPVAGSYGTAYGSAYAPYSSRYTPAATPYLGVDPSSATVPANPIVSNGAYQAQRPTYYDNPSVYTGQPVTGNVQTSFRAPLTTAPVTASAFPTATYQAGYGAANSGYVAAYPGTVPPSQPMPVGATTGIPATAVAVTPAPVYPSTPAPSGGCFGSFCRKLFGTSYTTSYYRAPVTYYRPVTSLNPTTGTTVTVQQPCTAYEQQVQRTPFTTFQPSSPAAPPSTCPSNCGPSANSSCNATPYGQTPAFGTPTPFGSAPSGGVGQVNAIGSGDRQTVPIPSIPPAGQSYPQAGQSNLSPLTGSPPTLAPPTFAPAQPSPPTTAAPPSTPTIAPPTSPTGDSSPVGQPSLNKAPTEETSTGASEKTNDRPPSYWQLQNAEDSTAMIPNRTTQPTHSDPASLSGGYGLAQPIRAPADYVAPFGRAPNTTMAPVTPAPPASSNPFPQASPSTPALPAPSYDPSDLTSVSHRISSPARNQFGSAQPSAAPHRANQARDTTWTSLGQ
ncbi:MAG: hypothetical protein ACR2NZ_25610 [Rubripirellula sp.]